MITSDFRYVTLDRADDQCEVGIDNDGQIAAIGGVPSHPVVFSSPISAEIVADRFRREGWTAKVCEMPRY